MNCTQKDIARVVGLDVSSVNKILNKKAGPVFKATTIKRVFQTARKMGYDFNNPSRAGRCRLALLEIVRGGHLTGVSYTKRMWYLRLAYGKV